MQKELYFMFGNGHRENDLFSLNAGESVTCHFKVDGSDSATDRYFNLTSEAKKVSVRVNKVATITHIENKELKAPITLGTDAINTFSEGIEWGRITVRADIDSTVFEIYAS